MEPSRKSQAPKIGPTTSSVPRSYHPILRLWVLRLLKLGGGPFSERHNRVDVTRAALETAGLQPVGNPYLPLEPEALKAGEAAFRQALVSAETFLPTLPDNTPMAKNLT